MGIYLNLTDEAPCICLDGPLMGKKDTIACIGPDSPCDKKYYFRDEKLIKYAVKVIYENDIPCYEKDSSGRYTLYHLED